MLAYIPLHKENNYVKEQYFGNSYTLELGISLFNTE